MKTTALSCIRTLTLFLSLTASSHADLTVEITQTVYSKRFDSKAFFHGGQIRIDLPFRKETVLISKPGEATLIDHEKKTYIRQSLWPEEIPQEDSIRKNSDALKLKFTGRQKEVQVTNKDTGKTNSLKVEEFTVFEYGDESLVLWVARDFPAGADYSAYLSSIVFTPAIRKAIRTATGKEITFPGFPAIQEPNEYIEERVTGYSTQPLDDKLFIIPNGYNNISAQKERVSVIPNSADTAEDHIPIVPSGWSISKLLILESHFPSRAKGEMAKNEFSRDTIEQSAKWDRELNIESSAKFEIKSADKINYKVGINVYDTAERAKTRFQSAMDRLGKVQNVPNIGEEAKCVYSDDYSIMHIRSGRYHATLSVDQNATASKEFQLVASLLHTSLSKQP